MVQLFQFVEKICISTDCFQAACEIGYHELSFVHKGGGQNKGFHSGPIMWVSYFGLWVTGPHNFSCCVGWVPLPFQKKSDSLFSPNLSHFSQLTSIFTHSFPVFVLCTSILAVFMLRASLLAPSFCSFYLSGCLSHPSNVTVLRR